MQDKSRDHPQQFFLFDARRPAAPVAGEPIASSSGRSNRTPIGPAAVAPELAEIAAEFPPTVRFGTSSWSFGGWMGIVYDRSATDQRLAREGLQAYSRHPLLRTVGIDRTYYAPLEAAEFARYAADTPAEFRFLVKAWEGITCRKLRSSRRDAGPSSRASERFLDAPAATSLVVEPLLAGLGEKAGPLVFQFTPMSRRELGEPAAFVDRLHRFLTALPRGPLYAIEVRNRELLTEQYREMLIDAAASHCFTVHPSMPPIRAQAELLRGAAQPAFVARWMLNGKWDYEGARAQYSPFDRLVDEDPANRGGISALCIDAVARNLPVYVIANNKAEGSAPLTIFRLAALVSEKLRQGRA